MEISLSVNDEVSNVNPFTFLGGRKEIYFPQVSSLSSEGRCSPARSDTADGSWEFIDLCIGNSF